MLSRTIPRLMGLAEIFRQGVIKQNCFPERQKCHIGGNVRNCVDVSFVLVKVRVFYFTQNSLQHVHGLAQVWQFISLDRASKYQRIGPELHYENVPFELSGWKEQERERPSPWGRAHVLYSWAPWGIESSGDLFVAVIAVNEVFPWEVNVLLQLRFCSAGGKTVTKGNNSNCELKHIFLIFPSLFSISLSLSTKDHNTWIQYIYRTYLFTGRTIGVAGAFLIGSHLSFNIKLFWEGKFYYCITSPDCFLQLWLFSLDFDTAQVQSLNSCDGTLDFNGLLAMRFRVPGSGKDWRKFRWLEDRTLRPQTEPSRGARSSPFILHLLEYHESLNHSKTQSC